MGSEVLKSEFRNEKWGQRMWHGVIREYWDSLQVKKEESFLFRPRKKLR